MKSRRRAIIDLVACALVHRGCTTTTTTTNAFHAIGNELHANIEGGTNTRLRVWDGDSTYGSGRRIFLTATSATIFLSFVTTSPRGVYASDESSDGLSSAPEDVDVDAQHASFATEGTATTPSILSEDTLVISDPSPARATVDVKRGGGRIVDEGNGGSPDIRFFVAGGASAALSHGIATPVDVVKTRMQGDDELAIVSPFDAAIKIVEADGPNALLVGFGPTIIGYGIEGAVKFGTYESLKRPFLSLLYDGGCGATQAYLAAAAFAGAVASIVLCPLEETRIRLVTDPSFGTGLFDGLPRLLREDGMLSPFRRGMAPMLIKQVPYTIGKQVSFDVFASLLYSTLIGMSFVPQKKIALEVEIGAAFCASVVACLASHPGDVLLTATYGNGGDPNNDTAGGIISTFRRVGERGGGLSNFFRGLDARFLHVGCIITLQLVLYDQLKQALGLPASGT